MLVVVGEKIIWYGTDMCGRGGGDHMAMMDSFLHTVRLTACFQ